MHSGRSVVTKQRDVEERHVLAKSELDDEKNPKDVGKGINQRLLADHPGAPLNLSRTYERLQDTMASSVHVRSQVSAVNATHHLF